MAKGSFYLNSSASNDNGTYMRGWVEWSATPNTEENYSTVNVSSLQVRKYNSTKETIGGWSWSIYIDGIKAGSGSTYEHVGSNWVSLGSASLKVNHNSSGDKSVSIYASISGPSGTSYANLSTSGSSMAVLDTIPQASVITATDANIGSTATIIINRAAAGFTDTLTYTFGNLSGEIETKANATSIEWVVPTDFYAQIPKAKSGTVTITCKTYNGDTQIGTSTCTMTVTAAQSLCVPTVKGAVLDTNVVTTALTGDSSKLVRYCSKAECTITATAKNSAAIIGKSIGGVAVTDNKRIIENVEESSFVFTATDSRGYSASDTVSPTVVQYIKLTNNASASRVDPTSGKVTLTLSGNYFNGSFGAKSNTLTVKYRRKQLGGSYGSYTTAGLAKSGNTYSNTLTLTGYTYTSAWVIEVVATDALMTVKKEITVNKGIPVFDWGESNFSFHVPVKFGESGVLAQTRANLGAASSSHTHSAGNITSGTFPIVRGGTGATTAAGALDNLGAAAKWNVLWTNGSPTSSFAAQTLTISGLSGYNLITIITEYSTNYMSYLASVMGYLFASSGVILMANNAWGTYAGQRLFTVNSASNSIEVASGYALSVNNHSYSKFDTYAVPRIILGAKI